MSNYYDTPDMVPVSDVAPLVKELEERRRDDWKRKALEQFPNIAPLVDLVQANSEENYLDTARDMSERLSAAGNPGVAGPTRFAGAGVPVTAGSPALPPSPNLQDELDDAKRRARAGDERAWTDAFRLLRRKQAGEY